MSGSEQPVDPNAIVQYRTNNDGTLSSLSRARVALDPALAAKVKAAMDAANTDDDPNTTPGTAFEEVMAGQPDVIYVSTKGTYYSAKAPKYFGDSELVTPSPVLVDIVDKLGEIGIDKANDLVHSLSAAVDGNVEDTLALLNEYANVAAGTTVNPPAATDKTTDTQKQ